MREGKEEKRRRYETDIPVIALSLSLESEVGWLGQWLQWKNTGPGNNTCMWLRECCRQGEAELIN